MIVEPYKVPTNYKPTAAVVKANPTVKSYSTGQIINNPVPTGSFLAAGGTVARTSTGTFNIAPAPTSTIWTPPPTFSVAPTTRTSTSSGAYSGSVQGGLGAGFMGAPYVPLSTAVPTSGSGGGSGGGGGSVGGGALTASNTTTGGTSAAGQPLPSTPKLGIGNNVEQMMTWRVG